MSSRAALVDAVCAASDVVRRRTHERVKRDIVAARHLPGEASGEALGGAFDDRAFNDHAIDDHAIDDQAIDAAIDLQHEQIATALRKTMSAEGGPPGRRQNPAVPGPTACRFAPVRIRPDLVLAVCGAAVKETIGCVRSIGAEMGCDPTTILDVVGSVVDASDGSLLPAESAGQDGSELPQASSDEEQRASLARALLLGGGISAEIRSQISYFGLNTGRTYVTFRACPRSGHSIRDLAQELGHGRSHRPGDGLTTVTLDGDLAGFLATPPTRVRAGVVGLGPAGILERLSESFELATRTLQTVRAFGLSGVHTFDGLGLLPTILADVDTGESLCHRYLEPLAGAMPLLNAIRTYFACGMRIDRAAKQLCVHPNTLRHRISRFEKLAGADLSDLSIAMEVWWALAHTARCGVARALKSPAQAARAA